MARLPTTLIAQPITLAGAWTATVTDAAGAGRTATIVAGGSTQYARPYLARLGSTGTLTDPHELLALIQAGLNAALPGGWTVALATDGRVRITYNGAGSGTIAAGEVATVLGFSGAVGALATGASQTGTYPPVGLLCAFSVTEDSGWEAVPSHVAASRAANGTVVALATAYTSALRSFGLRFHPRTWAEQASGEYLSPAFPSDASPALFTEPVAPTKTSAAPWSVHELLATAAGRKLGLAISNAQELLSGASTRFDVGYFAPEVYESKRGRVQLPAQAPTWNARRDWPGIVVTRVTSETR